MSDDLVKQSMTRLRKKRLLLLAKHHGACSRWYGQYLHLQNEGLVNWHLGSAFLTDKGVIELDEMEKSDEPNK